MSPPPVDQTANWLAAFEAACTFIASACAVWVTVRDGRWRKSGLAAKLVDSVARAQKSADNWHESPHHTDLVAKANAIADRVTAVENKVAHAATKADLAKLEGKMGEVLVQAEAAAHGVNRIEGLLMERALDR